MEWLGYLKKIICKVFLRCLKLNVTNRINLFSYRKEKNFLCIFALFFYFGIMAYKKLTRSFSDRKIAGVCGGVARYLDVDPTVVRIIFLVMFLAGSIGLWLYLIIWIAAPEE